MSNNGSNILRMVLVLFLSVIIIASGITIWMNYEPEEIILIEPDATTEWEGTIYIDGAINQPGYYPCCGEDDITSLVNAAGGYPDYTRINSLVLIINDDNTTPSFQKVDINRAEVWLLQALPGIGESLAQRICDHRDIYGPFTSTTGLLEVEGIGPSIYETIRDLITVSGG